LTKLPWIKTIVLDFAIVFMFDVAFVASC